VDVWLVRLDRLCRVKTGSARHCRSWARTCSSCLRRAGDGVGAEGFVLRGGRTVDQPAQGAH
jgi:hypothetical protein